MASASRTARSHRDKRKIDDVDSEFALSSFEYGAIAQQIRQERVDGNKKAPKVERLTDAILSVSVMDTVEGSSTLEITVADPEFELYEFFDIDRDGKLDKIEIQYPPRSANWWRLTQLGLSTQAGQALELTLTFMERPVVLLLHKKGPKKTRRGKTTRAEFLRSLVQDVKEHPLKFKSDELHVKQDIAGTQKVDPKDRHDNKGQGLHKGDDVTVKGIKANPTQIGQAERALDVAKRLHAPHDAAVALMMTAIGESNMGALMTNQGGSKYSGMFAADPANVPPSDTEMMAKYCLIGGKGFNAPEGGLIGGVKAMHKEKTDSYRSLGHLCYVNQGNRSNFGSDKAAEDFFGEHESEAEAWVAAYGDGFGGGSTYYRAQYNFQIGTPEHPKERYWDGMKELANEVRWRLFVDGRTVFFDSDMTLIRQKPAAVIYRHDPALIGFDANWDGERHMATEMTMELICEPFQFRAGQVFKLIGFGPLSTGSTARPKGLPGRWLIWEINRQSGSYSSTFTLRQPEREKLEPATEIRERERQPNAGGRLKDIDSGMTPKEIIDEFVLPIGRKHNAFASGGGTLNAANVKAANDSHGATSSGGRSDHQGPASQAWAADMAFHGAIDSKDGDGLADELARLFGMNVHHNHVYDFGTDDKTKDGLRYQLGWKVTGHHDHVHFGVKVVDLTKRAASPEDFYGKSDWSSSDAIRSGPLGY